MGMQAIDQQFSLGIGKDQSVLLPEVNLLPALPLNNCILFIDRCQLIILCLTSKHFLHISNVHHRLVNFTSVIWSLLKKELALN